MELVNPNILQPVITAACIIVPGLISHRATSNALHGPKTREAMTTVNIATGIGVLATLTIGIIELLSGQGVGAWTINAAIATISTQVGGRLGE